MKHMVIVMVNAVINPRKHFNWSQTTFWKMDLEINKVRILQWSQSRFTTSAKWKNLNLPTTLQKDNHIRYKADTKEQIHLQCIIAIHQIRSVSIGT